MVPSVAGPKRPQDRIELPKLKNEFTTAFAKPITENGLTIEVRSLVEWLLQPELPRAV